MHQRSLLAAPLEREVHTDREHAVVRPARRSPVVVRDVQGARPPVPTGRTRTRCARAASRPDPRTRAGTVQPIPPMANHFSAMVSVRRALTYGPPSNGTVPPTSGDSAERAAAEPRPAVAEVNLGSVHRERVLWPDRPPVVEAQVERPVAPVVPADPPQHPHPASGRERRRLGAEAQERRAPGPERRDRARPGAIDAAVVDERRERERVRVEPCTARAAPGAALAGASALASARAASGVPG